MKLDRNLNPDGGGKYAIVNMRKYREATDPTGAIQKAFAVLQDAGIIDLGIVGTPSEFFLLKLKDRHARATLLAYERSIEPKDPEFALEVATMAARAGKLNPWCKEPD